MNRIFLCLLLLLAMTTVVVAAPSDTIAASAASDSTSLLLDEAAAEMSDTTMLESMADGNGSAYSQLKVKFVEGGAGFMSLVALCLIIGLAFCIERIISLSMSEIDAKKFMRDIEKRIKNKKYKIIYLNKKIRKQRHQIIK